MNSQQAPVGFWFENKDFYSTQPQVNFAELDIDGLYHGGEWNWAYERCVELGPIS